MKKNQATPGAAKAAAPEAAKRDLGWLWMTLLSTALLAGFLYLIYVNAKPYL